MTKASFLKITKGRNSMYQFSDHVNGIPFCTKSKEVFVNGNYQDEAVNTYLYALNKLIEKLPLTSEIKRKKLLKEKSQIEKFLFERI